MSDTNTNNQTTTVDENLNSNNTESKVFTEDYVKALRAEAKQNRLSAKSFETKLRQILGVEQDAEISDFDNAITAFKDNLSKAQEENITKFKGMLLKNKLQTFENTYDMKLVDKLLDTAKINIDENFNINGLEDALRELAEEYPQIIKNSTPMAGANPVINTNKTKTNVFDVINSIKTRK